MNSQTQKMSPKVFGDLKRKAIESLNEFFRYQNEIAPDCTKEDAAALFSSIFETMYTVAYKKGVEAGKATAALSNEIQASHTGNLK